jgi:hypothetical protein
MDEIGTKDQPLSLAAWSAIGKEIKDSKAAEEPIGVTAALKETEKSAGSMLWGLWEAMTAEVKDVIVGHKPTPRSF